jgi:arsenate reductase
LLNDKGIEHTYREYTQDPLSQKELKEIFKVLDVSPKKLLRKNDKAYKENGLTGDETDAQLIKLMAQHPTLLQRPIGLVGSGAKMKAAVGRPVENLLELA